MEQPRKRCDRAELKVWLWTEDSALHHEANALHHSRTLVCVRWMREGKANKTILIMVIERHLQAKAGSSCTTMFRKTSLVLALAVAAGLAHPTLSICEVTWRDCSAAEIS